MNYARTMLKMHMHLLKICIISAVPIQLIKKNILTPAIYLLQMN